MAGIENREDLEAYISSSKYRLHVLEQLSERGQATPTEIAERVGEPQSHISRALSELREQGVVELRVSEARRIKRYYGLTESGEKAWSELEARIRSVEWSIEEPTDAAMQAVIKLSREEFGESLRIVVLYDGERITLPYADPDVLARYSDEEFERGLYSLVLEHSLDQFEMPNQDCCSAVINFDDFSVLKVFVDGETRISISVDNAEDALVPDFAKTVLSAFETESST